MKKMNATYFEFQPSKAARIINKMITRIEKLEKQVKKLKLESEKEVLEEDE